MNEAIALFAAVLSAVAAAVGAAVSVAQWRQSAAQRRTTHAGGTPDNAHPAATAERPDVPLPRPKQSQLEGRVARRPSRSAVVAVALATLSCTFTAVGVFAYLFRQAEDGAPPNPLELFAILAIPISLVGIVAALISLRVGFRRNARFSTIAIIACLIPWVALWAFGH